MVKKNKSSSSLSRRDFLKLSGIALGGLALRPLSRFFNLPEYPLSSILGRNCTQGMIPIRSAPDVNSTLVRDIYEDTVLPWLREVPARNPDYNRPRNQRWVETTEGYVYAPYLQPVRNLPNTPLAELPAGQTDGFWAEITVPFVNLRVEGSSAWANRLQEAGYTPRLYYGQVVWIDQIQVGGDGQVLYRIKERFGSSDTFWAEGAAFRSISEEEVAPLSPDIDPNEKTIKVNVTNQTLSCFEAGREVFFCRVSTGALHNAYGERVDIWETPLGEHATHHKYVSLRMAAGTMESGYEEPCIGWAIFIVGSGVAIHSVHWHNDFGTPRSHGCINCRSEDSKWIFRWTTPSVTLAQGEGVWSDWTSGSTHVIVYEREY